MSFSSLDDLAKLYPVLYQEYPKLLAQIPHLSLGNFPTPVHLLTEFSKSLDQSELYIKRDDLSGAGYGGNKVRKVELYLADAQKKRRKTIITIGAAGSNHVAGVGYYCLLQNLACEAICFPQPLAQYVQKNLIFNFVNQVKLHPVATQYLLPFKTFSVYTKALREGRKPYLIPMGGTSGLGILGYVLAAFELASQIEQKLLPTPKRIYCALGTTGTCAGLILGLRLAGYPEIEVRPVCVVEKPFCGPRHLAFYINLANRFLRTFDPSIPYFNFKAKELKVIENQVGQAYAVFTPKGNQAKEVMWKTEKIPLEGTYTGKAFAGLIATEKKEPTKGPILFWNTINSANLSSYSQKTDWKQLPKEFHPYFTGTLQNEN